MMFKASVTFEADQEKHPDTIIWCIRLHMDVSYFLDIARQVYQLLTGSNFPDTSLRQLIEPQETQQIEKNILSTIKKSGSLNDE